MPSTPELPRGHSAWFYILWILALIILIPSVYIAIKFAFVEFQITQTRQDAQNALNQEESKYHDIQNAITQSPSATQIQPLAQPSPQPVALPVKKTSTVVSPSPSPTQKAPVQQTSPAAQTNQEKIDAVRSSFQMTVSGGWTMDHADYDPNSDEVIFTYVSPMPQGGTVPSIIYVIAAAVSNTHFTESAMEQSQSYEAEMLSNYQKTDTTISGSTRAILITGTDKSVGSEVALLYVYGPTYNYHISADDNLSTEMGTIRQMINTFKVLH
jgi:hypothetical protein